MSSHTFPLRLLNVAILLAVQSAVNAAEIKVDSLADSGAGSLREAIEGRATDGDVILLRAEGILKLKSPITVSSNITIKGQSGPLLHTIQLDTGDYQPVEPRLFVIGPGKTVSMTRLTLEGEGESPVLPLAVNGGAILSEGNLTVDNMVFKGHAVSGSGGAVYQEGGSLSVNNCYFSANTAGQNGGAIAVMNAPLFVASAGFEANTGILSGGAVYHAPGTGEGRPLYEGHDLLIRNSSLYGNLAASGAGIYLAGGNGRGVNLTLVQQDAPVSTAGDGSFTIANSLVENTGADWPALTDTVILEGNNLVDSFDALGLGEPGYYGGVSPTFPILPGSPALDAGDDSLAAGRDQRGLARISDIKEDADGARTVDLGAFEVQLYKVSALQIRGSATGGVDDQGFGNPFDPSDDADSIASADVFKQLTDTNKADIGDAVGANNAAGGGAILFSEKILPGTIFLKGSELEVRQDLAIYGPGANLLTINGDGRSRILKVFEKADLFLQGVTLHNGLADTGGGILVWDEDSLVRLESVHVWANHATSSGGGVGVQLGTVDIFRSSLIGNVSGGDGGGLFVEAGASAIVDTSTLSQNEAASRGGAVFAKGTLDILSSTFVGNTTAHTTPGVWLQSGGSGYVWNSIFLHDPAPSLVLADAGDFIAESGFNISDVAEWAINATATNEVVVGALEENAGATFSHPPVPFSPAINTGGNAYAATIDQAGKARPIPSDGNVDIGSIELQNNPPSLMRLDIAGEMAPYLIECETLTTTGVTVTAYFNDAEGDPLVIIWSLDGVDVESVDLAAGTTQASREFLLPYGASVISAELRDTYSFSGKKMITVEIVDTVPPVIVAGSLPDIQAALDAGSCTASVSFGATQTPTDDCSGFSSLSYYLDPTDSSTAITSPHAFDLGTTTVHAIAKDAAGNESAPVSFAVTVYDNQAPVITPPADILLSLTETGCDTTIDFPAEILSYINVEDCSGPVSLQVIINDTPVSSPYTFPLGMTLVQVVATDSASNPENGDQPNTASVSFNVTVEDTVAPTFVASSLPDAEISLVTDPGYCSAEYSVDIEATDCSGIQAIIYTLSGSEITFPYRFPTGISTVVCTAADNAGNVAEYTFSVTVTDPNFNCLFNIAWPYAHRLETSGDNIPVTKSQFLAFAGQSRWYKISVAPGSRVSIRLGDLPANYDFIIYEDIGASYLRLKELFETGDTETQEVALLGAEFAPEVFAPEVFAPEVFAPEIFAPEAFAPEAFAPEVFAPEIFAPEVFAPEVFAPEVFAPEIFAPEAFAPEVFAPEIFAPEVFAPEIFAPEIFAPEVFAPEIFAPEVFAGAQLSSLIAFSAYPGLVEEGLSFDTYTYSGDIYIRVRGSNGAFSTEEPFTISVSVEGGVCADVINPDEATEAELTAEEKALPEGVDGNYNTIILWDRARLGTETETAGLADKLQAFADLPDVAGIVVDLSTHARVRWANDQADLNPACPSAKNIVAEEIKKIIDAWWSAGNPLQYVVLLGNDDVIPFYRTDDGALLAPEVNYIPPVLSGNHSLSSLQYNQILTQDFYGSRCQISLSTGPYPFPELAVGRLVESVADIEAQLDNFILNLPTGILPPVSSALVTGYDFLSDVAEAVRLELEPALGGPEFVATLIADPRAAPSPEPTILETGEVLIPWNSLDLADAFLGSRHDLVFLAGHFSTGSTLAADYETRLTAEQVVRSGADLQDTVIFSAGCHSGYNTVDSHRVVGITKQPDWAQAFAQMGATLIAGTGYQYGDTEFIEYGERLYLEFTRELTSASSPVPVGLALNRAKQRYLAETPVMRGIHEKTLLQAALFGFPMLKVSVPVPQEPRALIGENPTITPVLVNGVEVDGVMVDGPGRALGLHAADYLVNPIQLTEEGQVLKVSGTANTVTARWFEGRDGFITNPAEPVRPLETHLVASDKQLAGEPPLLLRGVGFREGSYTDLSDFLPLTGAPTTEIRGVYGRFFSEVFFPAKPWSQNYIGEFCGGTAGERLNIFPTQFLGDNTTPYGEGTLRKYDSMDFRLYYSNNRKTYTNEAYPGFAVTPALDAAPAITRVSSTIVGNEAHFEITVLGSPFSGIHEVWVTCTGEKGTAYFGNWQSVDLHQDTTNETVWRGTLPLPEEYLPDGTSEPSVVYFMVQAVSGVGLVSLDTNYGRYFVVGQDPLLKRTPTQLSIIGSVPSPVAYSEEVSLTAELRDEATSDPLGGKNVSFKIGSARVSGITGPDGRVTVNLSTKTRPGQETLQIYFTGDRTYEATDVSTPVLVIKQDTQLIWNPAIPLPPAKIYGSDVVVSLSDVDGKPLKERTVFFYVFYPDSGYETGNAVITDISGRADLSEIFLPAGYAEITAYFNGSELDPIQLPGNQTVFIADAFYNPAKTVPPLAVTFAQPIQEDSLGFVPQQVDVYYKSAGKGGKNATVPQYESASVAGNIAFNVPLQPQDLLRFDSDPDSIEARVEVRLAGELIASDENILLDTRGNNGNHWTTASRPGEEVSYVGIHWSDAPRFDSALSNAPGPRIYTLFIGNNFTEFRYEPVPGLANYETLFPQGLIIAVNKDGKVDPGKSTGLIEGSYAVDDEGITFDAKFGLVPGMEFLTTGSAGNSSFTPILVVVRDTEPGINYLREGGRMIIRLAAMDLTPRPTSDAEPNLFDCRFILGNDELGVDADGVEQEQIQVRSRIRIGDALFALPWTKEDPGHKQYRP